MTTLTKEGTRARRLEAWLDTWSKSQIAVLLAVTIGLLALSLVLLNRLEFELKVNSILQKQVQTLKGGGK
jgi:hypothetical protein